MQTYLDLTRGIFLTLITIAMITTNILVAQNMETQEYRSKNSSQVNLVELSSGELVATFDSLTGSLLGIRKKNDKLGTNFLGDPSSVRGISNKDFRLTGNIIATVWDQTYFGPAGINLGETFKRSGEWVEELTGYSGDIRKMSIESDAVMIDYIGQSNSENGIRSFNLSMRFEFSDDGALLLTIQIKNILDHALEIGELGIPLLVNDDYAALYEDISTDEAQAQNLTSIKQRLIHEQKVFAHHFMGGHSSYTLVQRPKGDGTLLLVHPIGNTAFECSYEDREGKSEILAIHSKATKDIRRWRTPWVNGHTSLMLEEGEVRTFQLRFKFINDYPEIREELFRNGNLGIRVVPSMVIQENSSVYVEVKTREPINEIKTLSNGITVINRESPSDKELLTLSFSGPGQKKIRLNYGDEKWTTLVFYCTGDVESLIKSRGRFIAERQFLEDPSDPYNRNHMFLPFNHKIGSIFYDSDNVWEVGGSDEFGFSEPLFLAEKNVYYPSREEIDKLETYIDDCLFKYIQDPETYEVRASLYWKNRYPSSPWGHWTKERSEEVWRTYNYVHPANIYHAMYRIGKKYGLLKRRKVSEYLQMAYKTSMKWFNTGPWKYVGLMCGGNAINILEDLKKEGWDTEFKSLRSEMERCNQVFTNDPYPYSSELVIDQTAHEQVYFFSKYFGNTEKQLKTLKVIMALRGGNQPFWFRYGNDKRGDMACWYSESLNGWPLLDGFEETGNAEMFNKGYAGVMSVTANLREDGMGYGWFISSPGIFDWRPPRTLDNGIGQYGFFKAAKAYVLQDSVFGLIGAGCRISSEGEKIIVDLKDGLKKRIFFTTNRMQIEVFKGELNQVLLIPSTNSLQLRIGDSTKLVNEASFIIKGLPRGKYEIQHLGGKKVQSCDGTLEVSVKMSKAGQINISPI